MYVISGFGYISDCINCATPPRQESDDVAVDELAVTSYGNASSRWRVARAYLH